MKMKKKTRKIRFKWLTYCLLGIFIIASINVSNAARVIIVNSPAYVVDPFYDDGYVYQEYWGSGQYVTYPEEEFVWYGNEGGRHWHGHHNRGHHHHH